jgi:hypothetical protein
MTAYKKNNVYLGDASRMLTQYINYDMYVSPYYKCDLSRHMYVQF